MNRRLDRDVRLLQRSARIVRHKVAQLIEQHWYESCPPIGVTVAGVADDDFSIILLPIRLAAWMKLRKVTLRARAADGMNNCDFATAIYRAVLPTATTKDELVISPGRFSLSFISRVGLTIEPGAAIGLFHHFASADIMLDPVHQYFLALQVGSASNTEFYCPMGKTTPNVGYLAGFVGSRFDEFPQDLDVRDDVRTFIPYFVLRSAVGARLFGNTE